MFIHLQNKTFLMLIHVTDCHVIKVLYQNLLSVGMPCLGTWQEELMLSVKIMVCSPDEILEEECL
jgi:hypothetical protein